jgi:putative SOS response-associated peptidase YedK
VINVRSETAARTPAFRDAFARQRCLVPATGFYEWQREASARPRPWLFRLQSGRVFAFAGLWQPATIPGSNGGCAILTTAPNDLARRIHDRMPAILDPADYAAWLDPAPTAPRKLQPLLRPFPADAMTAFPVNAAVNSAANDDPSCLEPA